MARSKESNYFNENPVSVMLTKIVNESTKNQTELTLEMGLSRSNVLTMFKQGRSPFPVKYVIPLCVATGRDPKELLMTVLREYMPEVLQAIDKIEKGVHSKDEELLLKSWRKAVAKKNDSPKMGRSEMNRFEKHIDETFFS